MRRIAALCFLLAALSCTKGPSRPPADSSREAVRDHKTRSVSTPLHAAAQAGDAGAVADGLDRGSAIGAEDAEERTRLYVAARLGKLDVATALLDQGAAVDGQETEFGFTPLHGAAQDHQLAVMALLLDRGATVDARNYHGQTPLWQASWQTRHPDTDALALLVDHGADINAADKDGFMPIHIAAETGNLPAVRFLLDQGADPNSTCQRWTVLEIAQDNGHDQVAALLLERGAKVVGADQPEELAVKQASRRERSSRPQRVFDESSMLATIDVSRFENYLDWIYIESDIDARFILTPDLGGLSLEEYAANRMTELGIGARGREERGILIVYDSTGGGLRIEVGYGLEDTFPDAFVDYLIREHTQTSFEAGDPTKGLMLLMRIIHERVRQAVFGKKFDPRALETARSHTLLSGGAGASRPVELGNDPNRYFRSKLDADRRRYFGAQPTPQKTRERYVEWLVGGQFDPDVEMLTPASRRVLASFPLTRAYFEWIARDEVGRTATKTLERDGLALMCFTDDPLAAPNFFRKTADGWQMDIATCNRAIKSITGGVYTWNWLGKNDEFSRTFADRLVQIRGYTRVIDADNRMLPIRGSSE